MLLSNESIHKYLYQKTLHKSIWDHQQSTHTSNKKKLSTYDRIVNKFEHPSSHIIGLNGKEQCP